LLSTELKANKKDNMAKRINTITILGGGSAGWMTAGLLANHIKYAKINLIESQSIPSIGVGEATLFSFKYFMQSCGYQEKDWYDECESSQKSGIYYYDWYGNKDHMWQPLYYNPEILVNNGITLFDLAKSTSLQIPTDIRELIPGYLKYVIKKEHSNINLGYHINAIKLADFLRQRTKINRIENDIIDLEYDEDGSLKCVVLKTGEKIYSDLFIDCLGLAKNSIIKQKNSSYEFIERSSYTPVNAAMARPINYTNKKEQQVPYTSAHATPFGWMWITPIDTRIGAGMVYNSDVSDSKEVEEWFINYWGKENLIGDKFNHIKFTPGNYKNPWNKNVVSIGLSSGFIEPIESSGLWTIQQAALFLLGKIRKGFFSDNDIEAFNGHMRLQYNEMFDFISLHYLGNKGRQEPFWKYTKDTITYSDTLKCRIDFIKNNRISHENNDFDVNFNGQIWAFMMLQDLDIKPYSEKIDTDIADEILIKYKNYIQNE